MKNILILILFLFSTSFSWGKTGFYSGAFDPPTITDIEVVKGSLQQFDKVILMIDRLAQEGKNYNTSAIERMEMLKAELEGLEERILIVVEPWSGKELYLNRLLTQEETQVIPKAEENLREIPSSISRIIENRRLYTATPEAMSDLKKSLYQETFQAFIREVSLLFPNDTLMDTPLQEFNPLASSLEWVDQFIYSVIREKHFNSDKADAFGKKVEKLLVSSERDRPYAKLHCLREVSFKHAPKPVAVQVPFALPTLPKDQKHTFNVETYCSDRFPKALFTSHLFNENEVYFHLGSTAEAIAYHQSEGFTETYEVNSQAVRKLRNYHLVRNPVTLEIRFIVSNLHGEDTLYHVGYQVSTISKFTKVQLVRHENPSSLFEVAPYFKDKRFQSTDTLIIGFKNAISRLLKKNPAWNKTTFSESGLHVDLYENTQTKQCVILSKCVYGDQLLELLDFFYAKGMRQFHYFGTSGSLSPDIHIGDAIIPLAFSTPQNALLSFPNKAANILQKINNEKVKLVKLHGWTQSPVQETENFLKILQKEGNQSLDVEARYYGEFFHAHPDAFASMVLFISDEPFGHITLDHFNTMDHYVDDAFNRVIDSFLP